MSVTSPATPTCSPPGAPPSDTEPGPWQPYDPEATALETLVEAEPAHEQASTSLRVEGGRRFRAALTADGRTAAAEALTVACPWDDSGLSPAHGVAALVRRRLPDGRALAALARSLATDADPSARLAALGIASADTASVIAVARSWLAWWEPRAEAAGEGDGFQPTAWNVPRLEYTFELAAPTAPAPVLRAPAYRSGRFDWAEVDLDDDEQSTGRLPAGRRTPHRGAVDSGSGDVRRHAGKSLLATGGCKRRLRPRRGVRVRLGPAAAHPVRDRLRQ